MPRPSIIPLALHKPKPSRKVASFSYPEELATLVAELAGRHELSAFVQSALRAEVERRKGVLISVT